MLSEKERVTVRIWLPNDDQPGRVSIDIPNLNLYYSFKNSKENIDTTIINIKNKAYSDDFRDEKRSPNIKFHFYSLDPYNISTQLEKISNTATKKFDSTLEYYKNCAPFVAILLDIDRGKPPPVNTLLDLIQILAELNSLEESLHSYTAIPALENN
jgi:hypothetical protein